MAIFRECKHSFRIVQALFGKSASTLVFPTAQRYEFRLSPCGHCLRVLSYEIASGVLGHYESPANRGAAIMQGERSVK